MQAQSGWQLAGTEPESYEQHNVIALSEAYKDLIALAELRAGERVLDVACGTGVLARLAARPSWRSSGAPATRPNSRLQTPPST